MKQSFNPKKSFLVGALLLAASGCTIQPTLPIDQVPVTLPERFSLEGKRQLKQQWWVELGDVQLQRLVSQALSNNQSLKVYEQRLLQAEALARKAGADLYPSLGFTSSAKTSRSQTNDNTSTTNNLLLGVAASYEIDLWGRLQATKDAAILDAQASKADLKTASLSLAAQLANIWYQLAASYSQQELLEQQQEINKVGLELVKLRINAGQVGVADLLQQEQLIESKNGELAEQRANSTVLENQLAVLTGVAPGMLELPDRPVLIELPPLPEAGVPADLLVNRPDIHSSYLALLAADRRAAVAIADKYPKLSFSVDLNSSGPKIRDLFDNWLASLAANLVAPIFNGGALRAESDRTLASAREKLHLYGSVLLTAVSEVEDALAKEKEQRLLLDSLELQLDLATRTVKNLKDNKSNTDL